MTDHVVINGDTLPADCEEAQIVMADAALRKRVRYKADTTHDDDDGSQFVIPKGIIATVVGRFSAPADPSVVLVVLRLADGRDVTVAEYELEDVDA